MNIKFYTKKYPQEGDLQHSYSALKNLLNEDNSIVSFNTDELSINLNNPLTIDCQPSYDGTVNLIINDDVNPPRIINTRFSKIEDNRYKIINRNQSEQTNLYKIGKIDSQTRLFRNVSKIPKFNFVELNYFGQLKGGMYTFYIKYSDDDSNKTDVVCESGQVSIFKGGLYDIKSISGTLQDELTDKSVKLELSNIDTSFSKVYLYYTREYSTTDGTRMSECVELVNPYDITEDSLSIIINGFEETNVIDMSNLNVKYNYVTNVKTQAQVQNMLFFGNVENVHVDIKNLQNISYFFDVRLKQKEKSIGWIDISTYEPDEKDICSFEYYDPKNIYYNLGYWPDEIYRLGVVYIMNDDSLSPVFNLRGCEFESHNVSNLDDRKYWEWDENSKKYKINYLERDEFLNSDKKFANTFGVFKNPIETDGIQIQNADTRETKPWYYQISIPSLEKVDLIGQLKQFGVKGLFFVRQKRIPMTLCQGLALGIEEESNLPVLYNNNIGEYFTESFLNQSSGAIDAHFESSKCSSKLRNGSALLSLDACIKPSLQSTFNGSQFLLQKTHSGKLSQDGRLFSINFDGKIGGTNRNVSCIFVSGGNPYKYVNGFEFSTKAGSATAVKEFSFFGDNTDKKYDKDYRKLVRGIYSPIIGVCANLENNAIYSVKISNYNSRYMKSYFEIRGNDNSEFYAISDRFELDNLKSIDVYRGDCFTNTVTMRLNRNFSDPDVPINNTIINKDTWTKNYGGYLHTTSNSENDDDVEYNWAKINRADLNAVPMGMWVGYKCLSNYNLGLRAENRSYVDEIALMGNPRSFYPLQDLNVHSSNNIEESYILNDGYSATVGRKINTIAPDVPYTKELFDNRIMFSNTQVEGDFKNAYRVFQGLSYKDIDRQYGAIVKLIPWGTNLLCIFEHGIGIVPINEKALMSTSTGQSIHMYGAGVLQNQVSLISSDFGSIWPESIIKTPIGIYGVDTYAKKIWKYSEKNGLETISDMKIQRFLNDNIKLKELDKYPIIGLKNVKTHYNNFKGDVMFTFYNFNEGVNWNFCYNERQGRWITRYSWTPLYSENVNNTFYSLDKNRSEILAHIYDNRNCKYGLKTTDNIWGLKNNEELKDYIDINVELVGVSLATNFDMTIDSIKSSYIDEEGKEQFIDLSSVIRYLNITDKGLIKTIRLDKLGMLSECKKYNLPYRIPLYYKIGITSIPKIENSTSSSKIKSTIGIVVDNKYYPEYYDELLVNGFYVHGRSGIFNEMDYSDLDMSNNITPTKWYDKQEPFEFEFVVKEPVGLHKIFDNLIIYSNNVAPESIQFEIEGDAYSLFKAKEGFDKNIKKEQYKNNTLFKNAVIKWDNVLNSFSILMTQECKSIEKFGRRLGNMHYKEDCWYVNISPLFFMKHGRLSSAKLRDKYLKVRVRYAGDELAVITAIKSLVNLSAS